MDDASYHPVEAGLVNPRGVIVEIVASERLVIDHREKREADVRQHEKI
jgi:hypothetical protein